MFSLADASGQRTASVALRNCIYLIPLGFLAYDCESQDFRTEILFAIYFSFFFFLFFFYFTLSVFLLAASLYYISSPFLGVLDLLWLIFFLDQFSPF